MTHQLRLPQKLEWQPITFIDLTTLLLAILALSSAAIFIRLNEENLGPNSTIFNRFWVGAIVLGVGQVITMRRQPPAVLTPLILWAGEIRPRCGEGSREDCQCSSIH